MKKKVLIGLMVGFSMVGMGQVPVANAYDFDFNDTFTSDNDMLRIDFTVDSDHTTVTFFTSSTLDGGFDPLFSLYNSLGALQFLSVDDSYSGTATSRGVSYAYDVPDFYLEQELNIGEYFAIVTQTFNGPKGWYFSDGFTYDDDPHYTRTEGLGGAPYFNNFGTTASGDLVFHILNVDTAVATYYNPDPGQDPNPVPVPGALLLLGSGLAGLMGVGYRRKK